MIFVIDLEPLGLELKSRDLISFVKKQISHFDEEKQEKPYFKLTIYIFVYTFCNARNNFCSKSFFKSFFLPVLQRSLKKFYLLPIDFY